MKAKEVVRVLERAGFYIHHQKGSHARLLHRTRHDLRVTIPIHSKDLPPSLLKRILKQAGLSEEEFLGYM
ncbi:MAG: type II toxin-antitoxin system HicA family toxin [Acidobacteriia bacterium]|nr:type II toxin-antitoxin system HicA family toxin [Terriglobia bacterium]